MSERDRNKEETNREDSNREETPGRQKINREDDSSAQNDQNESSVDKIIDKAAKIAKDKFGGGSKRR